MIMLRILLIISAIHVLILSSRLLADDKSQTGDEVTRVKGEYADVLAVRGTRKGEILAIAKILRKSVLGGSTLRNLMLEESGQRPNLTFSLVNSRFQTCR